jgi:hypothetical protein
MTRPSQETARTWRRSKSTVLGDPWRRRSAGLRSGHSELVEGCAEGDLWDMGGDVVVAAAQILHKRMTSGQDPC